MNNRKYYIGQNGKLVLVSEEIQKSINQETNFVRYRAIKRGECLASREGASRCDGVCDGCFHFVSQTASVEARNEQCNTQIADRYRAEQAFLAAEVIADAARVDPEYGERICHLVSLGYEEKDIAKALGMSLNVYRARFNRLQRRLR